MRLLFFFIIANVCLAATPTERLEAIGIPDNSLASQEIISRLMNRCESIGNSAYYYDELLKPSNNSFLECFELKKSLYDQRKIDVQTRRDTRNTAILFIKGYNCESVGSPLLKAFCRIYK